MTFKLPLDSPAFVSALHKGKGRALMHAREFGVSGLEDVVFDACLHDRAYDPQVEGDRTSWLSDILVASGSETQFAEKLIPQLAVPTEQYWDATQRCRMARRLAERGHIEARRCVYSSLRKWPNSADVVGAEDIIALDGADGLVHIADFFGTLIQVDPDYWADDMPIQWFNEHHGSSKGLEILRAAARQSMSTAVYLQQLDKRIEEKTRSKAIAEAGGAFINIENVSFDPSGWMAHVELMRKISAAEVIDKIENEDPQNNRFWCISWERHAAEAELLVVFEAMVRQADPERLLQVLTGLHMARLSTFDPRLLIYADHPDATVRWLANRALSNYAHPEVRRLAMARLQAGRWQEDELKLLKRNYQAGDAVILKTALKVPEDRDKLHQLVLALVGLFKSNQVAESERAMLFVYEESPCSNCRCEAVEILVGTGNAPTWLREECRYDSSEKTRRAVAKKV